eukprot:TRINITY_DN2790_c0_g3_i2.p1 TRINITY_DN2790_c0_g3~~TRINITY_DN2790_c0_g3_i2.p1  ORF type:complete len:1707 (-),score=254.44 TRINITY_DN2790_c0_g3_i2:352-5472(-)
MLFCDVRFDHPEGARGLNEAADPAKCGVGGRKCSMDKIAPGECCDPSSPSSCGICPYGTEDETVDKCFTGNKCAQQPSAGQCCSSETCKHCTSKGDEIATVAECPGISPPRKCWKEKYEERDCCEKPGSCTNCGKLGDEVEFIDKCPGSRKCQQASYGVGDCCDDDSCKKCEDGAEPDATCAGGKKCLKKPLANECCVPGDYSCGKCPGGAHEIADPKTCTGGRKCSPENVGEEGVCCERTNPTSCGKCKFGTESVDAHTCFTSARCAKEPKVGDCCTSETCPHCPFESQTAKPTECTLAGSPPRICSKEQLDAGDCCDNPGSCSKCTNGKHEVEFADTCPGSRKCMQAEYKIGDCCEEGVSCGECPEGSEVAVESLSGAKCAGGKRCMKKPKGGECCSPGGTCGECEFGDESAFLTDCPEQRRCLTKASLSANECCDEGGSCSRCPHGTDPEDVERCPGKRACIKLPAPTSCCWPGSSCQHCSFGSESVALLTCKGQRRCSKDVVGEEECCDAGGSCERCEYGSEPVEPDKPCIGPCIGSTKCSKKPEQSGCCLLDGSCKHCPEGPERHEIATPEDCPMSSRKCWKATLLPDDCCAAAGPEGGSCEKCENGFEPKGTKQCAGSMKCSQAIVAGGCCTPGATCDRCPNNVGDEPADPAKCESGRKCAEESYNVGDCCAYPGSCAKCPSGHESEFDYKCPALFKCSKAVLADGECCDDGPLGSCATCTSKGSELASSLICPSSRKCQKASYSAGDCCDPAATCEKCPHHFEDADSTVCPASMKCSQVLDVGSCCLSGSTCKRCLYGDEYSLKCSDQGSRQCSKEKLTYEDCCEEAGTSGASCEKCPDGLSEHTLQGDCPLPRRCRKATYTAGTCCDPTSGTCEKCPHGGHEFEIASKCPSSRKCNQASYEPSHCCDPDSTCDKCQHGHEAALLKDCPKSRRCSQVSYAEGDCCDADSSCKKCSRGDEIASVVDCPATSRKCSQALDVGACCASGSTCKRCLHGDEDSFKCSGAEGSRQCSKEKLTYEECCEVGESGASCEKCPDGKSEFALATACPKARRCQKETYTFGTCCDPNGPDSSCGRCPNGDEIEKDTVCPSSRKCNQETYNASHCCDPESTCKECPYGNEVALAEDCPAKRRCSQEKYTEGECCDAGTSCKKCPRGDEDASAEDCPASLRKCSQALDVGACCLAGSTCNRCLHGDEASLKCSAEGARQCSKAELTYEECCELGASGNSCTKCPGGKSEYALATACPSSRRCQKETYTAGTCCDATSSCEQCPGGEHEFEKASLCPSSRKCHEEKYEPRHCCEPGNTCNKCDHGDEAALPEDCPKSRRCSQAFYAEGDCCDPDSTCGKCEHGNEEASKEECPSSSRKCSQATCENLWIADWGDSPDARCQEWATNAEWGALANGATKEDSCTMPFARISCAKTCGCPKTTCSNIWDPGWGKTPDESCKAWAQNKEWGGVANGGLLHEHCQSPFARHFCAETCACPEVTCSDIWTPRWGKSPPESCREWAANSVWGALAGAGATLQKSCESGWARVNCAATCGCPEVQCVNTWEENWGASPDERCLKWATNKEWGALKDGASLDLSCKTDFARANCSLACGCAEAESCEDVYSDCQGWSGDKETATGALANGATLEESCKSDWARKNCARTCGCLKDSNDQPPAAPHLEPETRTQDDDGDDVLNITDAWENDANVECPCEPR